jgi:hypothetical protein
MVTELRQLMREIRAETLRKEREEQQLFFRVAVAANDDCCCGHWQDGGCLGPGHDDTPARRTPYYSL